MLKIRAKCKSANKGWSTVQLNGLDLIDIQVQSWLWKHSFYLYKTQVTIWFQWNPYNIGLQGLDIIDTHTNSIVELYFYLI